MQALLKTNALSLRRGDTLIASGLTLSAGPGDIVLLAGANGSGKTSLLRAMAGLLDTESGSVERNADFNWISAQELPGSTQTPRDYLTTQAALQDQPFVLTSDLFGIAHHLDTPLARLSTGWRQRVKLSRILVQSQPLWLLDEPSDGLDDHAQSILVNILSFHCARGGAAIIATHQPGIWPRNAKRIVMGIDTARGAA